MSAGLPDEPKGNPDWEAAVKAGQALLPTLDTAAMQDRAARQAARVAKFTGASQRPAPKVPQLRPRPEE